MRLSKFWLLVPLLLSAWSAGAADASDFASYPEYSRVKISPDGTYLSAATEIRGRAALRIIRLTDMQDVGRFVLGLNGAIDDYWWVGPARLVVSSAVQRGSLDRTSAIGELIGIDADGSHRAYLFGARAPLGSLGDAGFLNLFHEHRRSVEVAEIIDPRPDDARTAIISVQSIDTDSAIGQARAYAIDVYTGARRLIATAPIPGHSRFLADRDGTIRYVVSQTPDGRALSYVSTSADANWQLLSVGATNAARIVPIGFDTGDRIYLRSDEADGRDCLIEQNLDSGSTQPLSCDVSADIDRIVFSFDHQHPIAAIYSPGRPEFRYLDDGGPDGALLETMQSKFPGEVALPVSATSDGSRVILHVFSDRNPGQFFLFDRATGLANYLLSARSWVDPKTMAERQPISYAARDGQIIHGFLTWPPGKPQNALPMVVLPHGGPFGIRDEWAWDAEAQWLAANGYLVLQPNFRGSAGFGTAFSNAARQQWDRVVIDDITDGTRWAIERGFADAARIGIFGGSFGGYAALISAEREPELYRCVVDYAGVVDLKRWRQESDVAKTRAGRDFIETFIGADDQRLAAESPLALIDQLKAPVLIVHGKLDARAPLSQAKALRAELRAREIPYEWLIGEDEGHGFSNPRNRAEFLSRLVAFFDRHLAAIGTPPDATTVSVEPR